MAPFCSFLGTQSCLWNLVLQQRLGSFVGRAQTQLSCRLQTSACSWELIWEETKFLYRKSWLLECCSRSRLRWPCAMWPVISKESHQGLFGVTLISLSLWSSLWRCWAEKHSSRENLSIPRRARTYLWIFVSRILSTACRRQWYLSLQRQGVLRYRLIQGVFWKTVAVSMWAILAPCCQTPKLRRHTVQGGG